MPSSTKWRLNITARNHATYTGIYKITLSATAGGTDLATGGTASASSEFSAGFNAAKAFDADPASYWSTAASVLPVTIQYEFSGAVAIAAYGIRAKYAPKTWTFEYWDGSAWQVTDTQTDQTSWNDGETRYYPVQSKMRWRIHVTASAGPVIGPGIFTVIAEVQLRTAVAGANQATIGAQASASSQEGYPVSTTYVAANAIDGNTATDWSTLDTIYPHFWGYWFAAPTEIVEYQLRASSDVVGTNPDRVYMPGTWTLQYWNGTSWVVADTRTGAAEWGLSEARTFSVTAAGVETVQTFVRGPL